LWPRKFIGKIQIILISAGACMNEIKRHRSMTFVRETRDLRNFGLNKRRKVAGRKNRVQTGAQNDNGS
jgi:hypothetical protein